MARIREVRKRDNRIVQFDSTKIADAIHAAFRSVGEGERTVAVELASAVTHFLEEKFAGEEGPASRGSIPGIEEIQDLVETVLIEMGHARAAKAYILHRQKRAMMRETLQVRKVPAHEDGDPARYDDDAGTTGDGDAADSPPAGLPEVDLGTQGVARWQKSRIAAALIREADLDPSVAEEIASSVERKVIDSGIKRISTSLLRELVDNELFERGFSGKLLRQAPIGLPKYNLEQLIFGTDTKEGYAFPKTPPEVRNIISNQILHQYSLQEVFTAAVADAHRDGRIFIHRLSDPIRLARLEWRLPGPGADPAGASHDPGASHGPARASHGPARAFHDPAAASHSGPPASYLDLGDFFRRLWHLAHFFSEEVRLSGPGNLFLDAGFRSSTPEERARTILERLSQMDSRPAIVLDLDLEPGALPWLEGLRGLSTVRPGRFILSLALGHDLFSPGGEPVVRTLTDLYERGERVEFLLPREDAARSPPGQQKSDASRLAAIGAKITLNLPRAAFRSARDRRSSIEKEIEDVLDLAVKGHLERRCFIERLSANRENPLWDILGRQGGAPVLPIEEIEFRIGLLGLNECVKFLTGNDLHQDPEAARFGLDIVRGIHRKLRKEERSLGIRLVLEETANVGPLRSLERGDRSRYPQMAEIDRGRQAQWGPSYSDGVRFHRMAPVDPLRRVEELAPYLRYLEPAGGILEDVPELRSDAGELLPTLLEECMASPAWRGRE
jgi:hypothetical protein